MVVRGPRCFPRQSLGVCIPTQSMGTREVVYRLPCYGRPPGKGYPTTTATPAIFPLASYL